jgi:thioredoxin 1
MTDYFRLTLKKTRINIEVAFLFNNLIYIKNMVVVHLDKSNFETEVIKSKGIVLVDFFAQWCGPCKMTGPIIEQLADEIKNVKFVKVDVDQNQELSSQYQVFSIPTFLIFKDGQVVNQFVGAIGKEGFLAEIKKVMS